MATNPIIIPGNLNRVRVSATFPNNSALNIGMGYFAKTQVHTSMSDVAKSLPTQLGHVISEEPYSIAEFDFHVVRTLPLASAWKAQWETSAILGSMIVRPDTSVMSDFQITAAMLKSVSGLDFSGESAEIVLKILGIYYINSDLFAL